jgi:acetyl-CoA acyltransferase
MREVYIVSVGMIPFGKYPDSGIKDLTRQVMENLLKDGPVKRDQIQAAWMSNAGWGMQAGQHCIRGQVALGPLGIGEIPVMNVENACAGGSSALHGAWLGVAAGAYDIALAIGAEKTFVPPNATPEQKTQGFNSFLAGTDVEVTVRMIAEMQARAEQTRKEMEARGELKKGEGTGQRSPFMDIYSSGARAHMEKYGSTQRQLAMIAAKNHYHGSLNPYAQYQMDMSVDEVLNDRLVSHPLTRAMCAPMGDGAAAAILVSKDMLSLFDGIAPVKIRASILASATQSAERRLPVPVQRAYDMAGVGPSDIDTAEVHDATAFGELAQTESLGFCDVGEGGRFAESGATRLGGTIPVNPSGGLECRGHPIGASGLAQIAEMVYQLQGRAGKRQVAGARLALTENGGGFVGTGEAAVAIHILEGPTKKATGK